MTPSREAEAARGPVPVTDARRVTRPRGLFRVCLVLTAGWVVAFAAGRVLEQLGLVLGGYAAFATVVLVVVDRAGLARVLTARASHMIFGAVTGAALLLATYLVYPVLADLAPPVREDVRALYADTQVAGWAVPLLFVIMVVEELLWRGGMIEALEDRLPPVGAAAVATMAYALAQLGSGTWVVPALALGLGGIWAAMRLWTGSLWPPLIAHVMWTGTILFVRPLEAL